MKPTIKLQRKSLLFTKLSAELRLMIYEAVLGDSLHLTHICNVYDRCNHTYPIRGIDKASAYAEAKKGGSKFLSLLLSCHAM